MESRPYQGIPGSSLSKNNRGEGRQEQLNAEHEQEPGFDYIFLRKGNAFQRVAVNDIVMLKADRNYTTIYTHTDEYIYSIVLKQMEKRLPHKHFIRVHRSYLVNMQAITGFEGNMLYIGTQRIPVSRHCRMEVFRHFNVI